MASQDSPERLSTEARAVLERTPEWREAVAIGGVFGRDLSEVQQKSTDPDLLVRRAEHTFWGTELAVQTAGEAVDLNLTSEERRELVMEILVATRSQRERKYEQQSKDLNQKVLYLLEQLDDEGRDRFYEKYPEHSSVNTGEIERLVSADEVAEIEPEVEAPHWTKRAAGAIGKLAGTVLTRTGINRLT